MRKPLLILLLLLFAKLWASSPSNQPLMVKLGIYPVTLHSFNFASESFDVSFYLWTITNSPSYDPTKTLEVLNAVDFKIKHSYSFKLKNGLYHKNLHIIAKILHYWDVNNFPFDKQRLRIGFEDVDDKTGIVFIPDYQSSNLSKQLRVDGWKVKGMELEVKN